MIQPHGTTGDCWFIKFSNIFVFDRITGWTGFSESCLSLVHLFDLSIDGDGLLGLHSQACLTQFGYQASLYRGIPVI